MVENEFIIGQNSTNFIVHKGDWENSAVFTYLHIYFLKINSVTIQIVNDIDNIWCSPPKNLIALPLLHFSQNSIAILQYFNELESYWNIAIYCNNSINCNLLQYDAIKQRSDYYCKYVLVRGKYRDKINGVISRVCMKMG